MSTKTLTITIDNIPEGMFDDVWDYSVKEARKMFGGFVLPKTTNIKADFMSIIAADEETASELLGSAIASHLITAVHEKLNS